MVKVVQDVITSVALHEQNSHLRSCPPPTIYARTDRPVKALQLCCWKFSHKATL